MVNVTWAHWGVTPSALETERSWLRHESLLTLLLGERPRSLSGASESGSPIAKPGAWISLDPQERELKDKTDSLRDLVSSDPLLLWPQKWLEEKRMNSKGRKGGTRTPLRLEHLSTPTVQTRQYALSSMVLSSVS
jgi:hypothetical protein